MSSARFWRGVACATAGALLWGFSGACAQFLFSNYEISAAFVTMFRTFTAGCVFLAVLYVRERAVLRAMLADCATLARLAIFGLGLFGGQFAFVMSVSLTNAGTATVLQMSGTVFIMLLTCIFARKLPKWREFCGLLAAVLATWLIATQGDPSVLSLPLDGLLWGIANGLAVALYLMYPKRLFAQYGSFASTGMSMFACSAIAALLWVFGAALPVFGLEAAVGSHACAIPALDAFGWLALLGGVAFVGTFLAFGMYLHGVSIVGPVVGSLLGAFEPLGAMAVAALWLGTAFTGADWLGFLLMFVMLALVTAEPASPRRS